MRVIGDQKSRSEGKRPPMEVIGDQNSRSGGKKVNNNTVINRAGTPPPIKNAEVRILFAELGASFYKLVFSGRNHYNCERKKSFR